DDANDGHGVRLGVRRVGQVEFSHGGLLCAQLVSRVAASRYLAAVFSRTSSGSLGAGGVLFQTWVSSQSRTNCLSKDGGLMPTVYWSAGQRREESGVSTSSIRWSCPSSSSPNSNLVSAMIMPLLAANSAASAYSRRVTSRIFSASSLPTAFT